MKTIIAGSRTITDYNVLLDAIIECPWGITSVVSGGANGVDRLGERYAREHNLPLTVMPADWKGYGRRAGTIRNIEMAQNAEALLAIWDGESRVTRHMIHVATERGLRVHVVGVER